MISGQHRSAGENTRLILLGASTVVVFAVNAAGLFSGITTALPHLFYLPIVLAAYWFPRRGIVFALALSLGYLAMVLPFAGGDPGQIVPALSRAIFLVAVGAIISLLTLRLWNQEERYRGIFNNSEAATFVVAPGETGPRIEEANYMGTKLLGFAAKDLAGEPVTRFINDSNAWEEFQARIHRDGAVYGYETSLSRMDGTAVRVLVSGGRLPDGRSILTLVDITALKNAEDALRAANTKLNMLGHLTRNDLTAAVSLLLERIAEGARQFDDPAVSRYLDGLEEDARLVQRRAEITRDYQDLGLRLPGWQPVQEVIREVTSRLPLQGVSIRPWAERVEVFADPMLDKVFSNLIENAVRHGKTVTQVVITYQLRDDGLSIYVEDDGVGIPDTEKEKIFAYGIGGGGGLGLFLVREILSITGMTIRETGTPGEGARFVIHVPPDGYRIV